MATDGSLRYLRPLGALAVALTVIGLHAAELPVPGWADVIAPLMLATWFVDRSLYKLITLRRGGAK